MELYLHDCSKLSADKISSISNNGVLISSSYFKEESDLQNKLEKLNELGLFVCLNIDCSRSQIFGVKPHIAIYKACDYYEQNSREALELTVEKAYEVANKFISYGIDIYTSPILSFSENIFKSVNVNDNFNAHHIAIISAWIHGLNKAGMSCCIKLAPNFINNTSAHNSFYRLRVQISAIIPGSNKIHDIKRISKYNGIFLKEFTDTNDYQVSNLALKTMLGSHKELGSINSIDV